MLIVVNRLQNAQLTTPKLFSSSKNKSEESSAAIDNNGGGGDDVADEENIDDFQEQVPSKQRISKIEEATTTASTAIKSKFLDTQSALKDFDTLALQLRNKSLKTQRSCFQRLKRNGIHFAFVVYLLVGTTWYALDRKNKGMSSTAASKFIMGYYESITIGFSVGLGTKDPDYV